MPTQEEIYKTEGDKYEALIAREDYQGNIMRALREITSLENRVVYDLGAGTGRLACLLAPHVSAVRAFDISEEMLRVCREKFIASGLVNWQVDVADHRQLPVEDASADLVVSGWSVAYLAVWNPDSWRSELEKWLGEMKRVLKTEQPPSSCLNHLARGTNRQFNWNISRITIPGSMKSVSSINGSALIINSSRLMKLNICPAFSLVTNWAIR